MSLKQFSGLISKFGAALNVQQVRGMIRPPKNLPYRGIYKKDCETVRKGEVLVNQFKTNYHPGLNVVYENDRGEKLLRSLCDGIVKITREKCNPDYSIEEMKEYEYKKGIELYKLTFHVIPLEMLQRHTLVIEV